MGADSATPTDVRTITRSDARSGPAVAASRGFLHLYSAADVQSMRDLCEEAGVRPQPQPLDGCDQAPFQPEPAADPDRARRLADASLRLHPLPEERQGAEGRVSSAPLRRADLDLDPLRQF